MFEIYLNIFQWKVVLTFICFILLLLISHIKKRRSHPPGPLGFPLVGLLPIKIIQIILSNYFPRFSERTYLRQMKAKYGDLWSAELGGQRVIGLASIELVTEAFVNNGITFAGKPSNEVFKIICEGKGVIFSNNEIWKENRRMSIRALREFGMGKNELVNQICDEGNDLIRYLSSISSSPIDTSHSFIKAVTNVISKLVFNEGNNYNDPEFDIYIKNNKSIFQSKVMNEECLVFPTFAASKFGRYLFPKVDEYFNAWGNVKEFVKNKCRKKLKSLNDTASPDCVFDYFWQNRYRESPDMTNDEKMDEISLTVSDIYIAASETTNSFMMYACLYLGINPDLQNDLRYELKNFTENYRQIHMDMKKQCPKWLSFIDEVHRYCNIVPKILRRALEPSEFRGYKIYPEDVLYMDMGTIAKDPMEFPNPDLFLPYRFLDESKTRYVPSKNLIPFGIGKRLCIGESITSMKSFLFLTRIVLCFNISLPKEVINNFDDIIEGDFGITHGPLDHFVNFHLINPI